MNKNLYFWTYTLDYGFDGQIVENGLFFYYEQEVREFLQSNQEMSGEILNENYFKINVKDVSFEKLCDEHNFLRCPPLYTLFKWLQRDVIHETGWEQIVEPI